MAVTDAQIIVSAARWTNETQYLRDFITKNRTPSIVKVVKGQYGTIGVPSLSNPGLQSIVLLLSTGKRRKVIAQAVKFKENRVVPVGSRVSIPDSYNGWFELLSEEGRSIKCIESVADLSKMKFDEKYLIRDSIKCLIGKEIAFFSQNCQKLAICKKSKHDICIDLSLLKLGADTINGLVLAEGSKIINAGEIITLCGEVQIPSLKNRHLKCQDSKGNILLLNFDQRGRFSPIATDDNVTGVHSISNLIDKKMPLTVRLVQGLSPRGLKNSNHFVPEMRFLHIFEEETLFALPLQKELNHVTMIPLNATLKLLKAKNSDSLTKMAEFQHLLDKCSKLVTEVVDSIQIVDSVKKSSSMALFRRSSSSDNVHQKGMLPQRVSDGIDINENIKEYDEIDQIYDYVRGFAPLPKNLRHSYSEPSSATNENLKFNYSLPPEPPPIETIPTKKPQAEKRNHRQTVRSLSQNQTDKLLSASTKLYLKNGQSNRSRFFRQKSSPPIKESLSSPSISPPILVKIGSPFFNLQYKSLSNLQQAMDLDGTLNSSNSGGRISIESPDGFVKQPEKRSKRLARPKSLTNLVWEIREAPVIVEKPKSLNCKKLSSKFFFSGHKRVGTLYL